MDARTIALDHYRRRRHRGSQHTCRLQERLLFVVFRIVTLLFLEHPTLFRNGCSRRRSGWTRTVTRTTARLLLLW